MLSIASFFILFQTFLWNCQGEIKKVLKNLGMKPLSAFSSIQDVTEYYTYAIA